MDTYNIDEKLIECIDSVLDMFGQNVKHMIYSNWLKTDLSAHRGVLGDPEGFAATLREFFGIGGASLEVLFVREIRRHFTQKLGVVLPYTSAHNFQQLVNEIRNISKENESI